jgi:RsiW-degrading membrane proteinase PrsW (M82 family)
MQDNLEEQQKLEREHQRWQGYAVILLIALATIFIGMIIIKSIDIFAVLSLIFGLVGIVLVVLWYTKENSCQINNRPLFLVLASDAIGVQSTFFVFELFKNYLSH